MIAEIITPEGSCLSYRKNAKLSVCPAVSLRGNGLSARHISMIASSMHVLDSLTLPLFLK